MFERGSFMHYKVENRYHMVLKVVVLCCFDLFVSFVRFARHIERSNSSFSRIKTNIFLDFYFDFRFFILPNSFAEIKSLGHYN